MKHIRNIFLLVILLLFSVITSHSQNEKLWEFDASPHGVYDVEHFGDNKFIYISHTQNTFYYITVRNLLDTTLVLQKKIDFWPWKIFISDDKDYFYLSGRLGGFQKYDYQLDLIESIPKLDIEGGVGETGQGPVDIDMSRDIAVFSQSRDNSQGQKIRRIAIYDLKNKELLGSIPVGNTLKDVQISPDGRYFTYSEDQWPAKVRFFDAQTYEHEFDLESTNDDDKDNRLDGYSFSPSGKYIIIEYGANRDYFVNYLISTRNIEFIIPENVRPPFKFFARYLTDDLFYTAPTFAPVDGLYIIRRQDFDSVAYFPPYFGFDNISFLNKYLIVNNGPIISLARFDPELVSVETENDTVEVYPQPSSGIFNISLDESYLDKEYSIYNVAGNVVSKGIINNIDSGSFQLNTHDIPKGVYYFVVGDFRCKIVRE